MGKRSYTHAQVLLPEIRAMVEAGKTQREIAEHFGFSSKEVVRELLKRERRKEAKIAAGIIPRPKAVHGKMDGLRTSEKTQSWNDCEWKTNCCGIFCN